MSDTFTRNKFRWLEQVNGDHSLPPLACKVSFWLSTFINRKTGTAWPSHDTLAQKAGCSRRGLQMTVDSLVAAGHLKIEINKGRGHTNVYRMAFKATKNANPSSPFEEEKCEPQFAFSDDKMRKPRQENAQSATAKMRKVRQENANPSSHNTFDEPFEGVEPFDEHSEGYSEGPPIIPPKRAPRRSEERGFDEFWQAFPRRKAKGAAQKAFDKAAKTTSPATIIAGARRYAAEEQGKDPKYTKYPATWLNGQCWLDEPDTSINGHGALIDQDGQPIAEPMAVRQPYRHAGQRNSKRETLDAINRAAQERSRQ